MTHFLRIAMPRLSSHQQLRAVVDRIIHVLNMAAIAPGGNSASDATHAAALSARAFRRGFSSRADETLQLAFLNVAIDRLKSSAKTTTAKSPARRRSDAGILQSAPRLFLLRELNYVISCIGAGAASLQVSLARFVVGIYIVRGTNVALGFGWHAIEQDQGNMLGLHR